MTRRRERVACPFGPAEAWLSEVYSRMRLSLDVCVFSCVDGVPLLRIEPGSAHTHPIDWVPDGCDRPVICISTRDLYSDECGCGFSRLFWHEFAHVVQGDARGHGAEWQAARIAVGHGAEIDILRQRRIEPWLPGLSDDDVLQMLKEKAA